MKYITKLAADEHHDNTAEILELALSLLTNLKDAEKAIERLLESQSSECRSSYAWILGYMHVAITKAETGEDPVEISLARPPAVARPPAAHAPFGSEEGVQK